MMCNINLNKISGIASETKPILLEDFAKVLAGLSKTYYAGVCEARLFYSPINQEGIFYEKSIGCILCRELKDEDKMIV